MAYNSAYTGSQVDAAVGAVRQKETIWDGKQDELTGTEDQLVGFNSAGEAVAVAKPDPLPTGGETGQVLTKTSTGAQWDDIPSDLPAGGTDGQILTKTADGVAWEDAPEAGVTSFKGRTGAVTPQEGDYTAGMVGARPDTWTPSAADVGAIPNPSGGTTGQILEKTATGTQWADKPSGGMSQTEADARYLQLSGGALTGDLGIGNSSVGFIPVNIGSFAVKAGGAPILDFVNTVAYGKGIWLRNSSKITNLRNPTDDTDAANKAYVDALKPNRLTATLSASGWSGNAQTITVNGVITNTSAQDIDISCADKASADAWAAGGVWCSNPTQANKLTFTCTTPPTANINLNIRLWEVG